MDVLRIFGSGAGIESLFPELAQCECEEVTDDVARNWLQERSGQVLLHDYCTLVHLDALFSFLGINIFFKMFQNTRQCHQPATEDVYLVVQYKVTKTRPRFNGRDVVDFTFHLVRIK